MRFRGRSFFYICRGALFYDFEFVAVGDRNRASSVRNFDTYEAAGNGEARRTRKAEVFAKNNRFVGFVEAEIAERDLGVKYADIRSEAVTATRVRVVVFPQRAGAPGHTPEIRRELAKDSFFFVVAVERFQPQKITDERVRARNIRVNVGASQWSERGQHGFEKRGVVGFIRDPGEERVVLTGFGYVARADEFAVLAHEVVLEKLAVERKRADSVFNRFGFGFCGVVAVKVGGGFQRERVKHVRGDIDGGKELRAVAPLDEHPPGQIFEQSVFVLVAREVI